MTYTQLLRGLRVTTQIVFEISWLLVNTASRLYRANRHYLVKSFRNKAKVGELPLEKGTLFLFIV